MTLESEEFDNVFVTIRKKMLIVMDKIFIDLKNSVL